MDPSPGSDQGWLEQGRGLLCPGVRTLRLEAGRCSEVPAHLLILHPSLLVLQRSAEQLN